MKNLILIFTLLLSNLLIAQEQDSIQKIINEQVWYPFVETYNNLDAEGFMDIHTDDIIRIGREGKSIRIGQEYAESQIKSAARSKERKSKRSISFSFTERFAKDDMAFESGYYKVEWESGEKSGISYGEFQVILKQEDGVWKIFVDSDTSYGGKLTEEDFQKGTLLK